MKKTAKEVFEMEFVIGISCSKCEVSDKENYSSELVLNFIFLYYQSKAYFYVHSAAISLYSYLLFK